MVCEIRNGFTYLLFFCPNYKEFNTKIEKYDIMLFVKGSGKMTDKELKKFIINFIEEKEKENENYIRYTYYELKVKRGLTENQIDEVLRVSRDYFENKGYNVYFTNAEFEYQNAKRRVEINEYMIAIKNRTSDN